MTLPAGGPGAPAAGQLAREMSGSAEVGRASAWRLLRDPDDDRDQDGDDCGEDDGQLLLEFGGFVAAPGDDHQDAGDGDRMRTAGQSRCMSAYPACLWGVSTVRAMASSSASIGASFPHRLLLDASSFLPSTGLSRAVAGMN